MIWKLKLLGENGKESFELNCDNADEAFMEKVKRDFINHQRVSDNIQKNKERMKKYHIQRKNKSETLIQPVVNSEIQPVIQPVIQQPKIDIRSVIYPDLFDKPPKILEKDKNPVSPLTIDSYKNFVKSIFKEFENKNLNDLFNNYCCEVVDYLDEIKNLNTRKKNYTLISSINQRYELQLNMTTYLKKAEDLKILIEKNNKTDSTFGEKKCPGVTYNQIVDAVSNIKPDNIFYASKQHICCALYTYINPRRTGDYRDFQIYKNKKDVNSSQKNYIIVKPNSIFMIIRDFKTVKTFGEFSYSIKTNINDEKPKILVLFNDYIKKNPCNMHIFNYNTSGPMSDYIKKSFHTITGHQVTSTDLRHKAINQFHENDTHGPGALEQMCINMGHTVKQHNDYRKGVCLDDD